MVLEFQKTYVHILLRNEANTQDTLKKIESFYIGSQSHPAGKWWLSPFTLCCIMCLRGKWICLVLAKRQGTLLSFYHPVSMSLITEVCIQIFQSELTTKLPFILSGFLYLNGRKVM